MEIFAAQVWWCKRISCEYLQDELTVTYEACSLDTELSGGSRDATPKQPYAELCFSIGALVRKADQP